MATTFLTAKTHFLALSQQFQSTQRNVQYDITNIQMTRNVIGDPEYPALEIYLHSWE